MNKAYTKCMLYLMTSVLMLHCVQAGCWDYCACALGNYGHDDEFYLDCRGRQLKFIPNGSSHGVQDSLLSESAVGPSPSSAVRHRLVSVVPWSNSRTLASEVIHYAWFTHNNLTKLHSREFQYLHILIELRLSYNHITEIQPNAFEGLVHVETLDVSHNKLMDVDMSLFLGMVGLNELSLAHNSIQNTLMDFDAFSGTNSSSETLPIETLDLSHNRIVNFPPGFFDVFTSLRDLDVSYNRLLQLPLISFPSFSRFAHNNINKLENSKIGDMSKTRLLELNNNNLSYINHTTAAMLEIYSNPNPDLEVISFDNPWRCDCVMLKLRETWSRHPIFLADAIECQEPTKLRGRNFWQVDETELVCGNEEVEKSVTAPTMLIVCVVVSSLVTLLLTLVVVVIVCQCRSKRYNMNNSPKIETTEMDKQG
uniref:Leucine-rich repeat-containing protein 15-like n=1 Tax=Saccoglossus kowalevskii TaxID=10224 RepID=A0ABM0MQ78_SACKO|nr:PREDICTED: leucine-rich repeat-containing protein 15-like [Saccoglossus kowalevskii]